MADPRFFKTSGPFTAGDIAQLTGAELRGDSTLLLTAVAPLDSAGPGQLSFLDNRKYIEAFRASAAAACFVHPSLADRAPAGMALLVSPQPYHAYAKAAQAFHPADKADGSIHPQAAIDPTATLGPGCEVGANAVIEAGAVLGVRVRVMANAVIGRNVTIGDECEIGYGASISHALIGARVRIYPGARIGQDGFGFAMGANGHIRIPQIGRVVIEDDVEIGANTTIDRGAGPDTVIGRGAMIDNLVQIGHNVQVGPFCVIIAQAGIAGSARMEHHAVLAAQAGIAGHVSIGAGARLGARSGAMRDVPAGAEMLGAPAMPIRDFWRQQVALERLTRKPTPSKGEKLDD